MCSRCTAPTEGQKQRRQEANAEKRQLLEQARDYGVTGLCREALQCRDPNVGEYVKVYTNAGRGYTVEWCGEVVYATQYLTQVTTVKKISCWIAELRSLAAQARREKNRAAVTRRLYASETRRIESKFSTC